MTDAGVQVSPRPANRDGVARRTVPMVLLALAAVGWWWSVKVADDMSGGGMDAMAGPMSLGAFVVAWLAMMAAMMLPAVLPVVKLYRLAAARGAVAPAPLFVAGYLVLWTTLALPAYVAWRALEMPLADGAAWAGRVAGATLLAAAAWQVSPMKSACLRHCRSPMGVFLRFGGDARRPAGAMRMGFVHGAYCIGCCWALFAVLVAAASMSVVWLVVFTGLIFAEKNLASGELVARAAAPALAALGAALLVAPSLITHIT